MGELQLAMQLPPAVAQERGAVRQVGVAVRLPLRPVADVVLADHAVGTGHAHQRAQIDEQPLQPQRAVIGAVDEAAMHAERMAEADGDGRGGEEQRQRAPGEIERPADQGRQRHAPRSTATLTGFQCTLAPRPRPSPRHRTCAASGTCSPTARSASSTASKDVAERCRRCVQPVPRRRSSSWPSPPSTIPCVSSAHALSAAASYNFIVI